MAEPQFPTSRPAAGDWAKLTVGGTTKIWDPATKSYQLPGTINKRLVSQGQKPITVQGKAPTAAAPGKPPAAAPRTPPTAPPPVPTAAPRTPPTAPPPVPTAAPRTPPTAPPPVPTAAPRTPPTAPPPVPTAAPRTPAAAPAPATRSTPLWDGPSAPTGAKPAAAPAAPAAPVKSTNPMGDWAAANQKLAAVAAEKSRIRGTAQTDNPLMKDFRSRLPAGSPTVQAPDFQKTLAGSSGNQRLIANPNAGITPRPIVPIGNGAARPTPPVVATQPAAKPTTSTPTVKTQPTIKTQPTAVLKKPASTPAGKTMLTQSYEYEPYDIILEYLINGGHADTLEEANYLMLEMDQSSVHSIMEVYEDYILSEEISEWVDNLINDGHDLSDYNWDEIVEYYIANR